MSIKNRRVSPATASSACASTARAPVFDIITARARWPAACAEYDAADRCYAAMCREADQVPPASAAEHSKRMMKIFEEEGVLGKFMDRKDAAASKILAVPASSEALQLKIDLFSHIWPKSGDANQPLNSSDPRDVAAIVLDLLTMGRGEAAELAKAA